MVRNEIDDEANGIDDEHDDPLAYATGYHAPVLWKDVLAGLVTDANGTFVDGTLGGGGHAASLLDALEEGGRVIGIDRDRAALEEAGRRLSEDVQAGRLTLLHGNFGDMRVLLERAGVVRVEGILLDLGISSHQVDEPARGFSYASEGALDMRMDTSSPLSAADVVNHWSESELRQTLFEYGEEPRARAIVQAIMRDRPIETTAALARTVRGAVPQRDEVKTLSRVFQAVRIAVNHELDALDTALKEAVDLLKMGGRMAVISYHSLEDRRVKRFFRYGNLAGSPARDVYGNLLTPWKELTRRPIRPSEAEVAANPRSRSARLRIAEREETFGSTSGTAEK